MISTATDAYYTAFRPHVQERIGPSILECRDSSPVSFGPENIWYLLPIKGDVIEDIETKSLNPNQALATVKYAIEAFKDAGVPEPSRIPWGK